MKKLALALLSLALVGQAVAQEADKPDAPIYHFDFVVKELEAGKVVSSRTHSLNASSAGSLRSSDKAPITNTSGFTFIDIGTNIDCREIRLRGNALSMRIIAEILTTSTVAGAPSPTITQTRWDSLALVPLRKPTVVFSSDGASSKRQLQLEITATPLQ